MQGIGQVMLENTVYDDDGQLVTGSYMDYCMPRADNLCDIDFSTRNVPATTNPLGVKGCGEAGNGGSMAASMCAILHALEPVGVVHLDGSTVVDIHTRRCVSVPVVQCSLDRSEAGQICTRCGSPLNHSIGSGSIGPFDAAGAPTRIWCVSPAIGHVFLPRLVKEQHRLSVGKQAW